MRAGWRFGVVGTLAAFGLGCESEDSPAATGGDTTSATVFAEGNFQLTTHAVDDSCVDGALDLVFMPNGVDTPYDLTNPTRLPASNALPATYDITLQAPFETLNVTVAADGANMKIEDSVQTGIVVDADQWKDCKADMSIDAAIVPSGADNVTVTATVTVSTWTGADCPAEAKAGCTVKLDMKGKRLD